jgi:hypothetical protein
MDTPRRNSQVFLPKMRKYKLAYPVFRFRAQSSSLFIMAIRSSGIESRSIPNRSM